ncbi:Kynureninase [Acropora cervicornis]|uniref:Kynureninase n=1 Tax=Acropora cervicornis TaxID=6130 RepID=A0AAD9QEW1_ACRCE|nr:Kynureninase [Acropora cervicornis]
MSKCSKQLNFKPARTLIRLLKETKLQISDEAFAKFLDEQDELKNLREDFWYPKMKDLPPVDLSFVDEGADSLYFCGNSLGIQPKEAGVVVKEEMEKWQKIRMLLISSVKEKKMRIQDEYSKAKMHYAIQSQIRYHGYDPAESIVEVVPRKDEEILRTEDIISIIEEQGDSIALGCVVGWDLAHAVGNVELKLHDWNYLNGGPGAVAGAFIHERHAYNFDLPKFAEFESIPAYLELLLVYHYGYSDREAPSKTLQNGICSNKNVHISILTPIDPSQRGCQLSVQFSVLLKAVHNELEKRGVVVSPVVPEGNLHERSSSSRCGMLCIKI